MYSILLCKISHNLLCEFSPNFCWALSGDFKGDIFIAQWEKNTKRSLKSVELSGTRAHQIFTNSYDKIQNAVSFDFEIHIPSMEFIDYIGKID